MVKESTAGAEEERGEETSVERGWESMGKEREKRERKEKLSKETNEHLVLVP
jgi:hypothetical protein